MVQSKCFTTSLASNYHPNDSMRKNSLTNNSISRLNLIQDYWQLPEKSNDFKSSVENKISLIKIYEKLNSVKILKNNRESITTKIKSMFEPFISYNFYLKFKRYIPYIQRDHQISKQIEEFGVGDEEETTTKTTIVPLTEEIEDEIDEILQNSNQLLVSAYSINIHTKDIMTLDGCNWLNDAVIEFYLNLIVSRSQMNDKNCNRKKLYPTVYAFSTYFFTRLSNGSGPGRWSNKLDFFSYDILLIPIHHSNHWRLAVVDNEQHSIEYYDSLGNEFRYCIDLIFNFLQNESIKKKNTELDIEKWRLQYKIPNIPKQQNYYDCGVFVCKYAEYISRRASLTFTQEHIPAFRKLMMYEIIHQKLIV
uniref:Sentrin-specific protease 1-like n=1 Tax=Dermatophagoides pteronyssinus TaxID=6956 RepID=A0A6P6YFG8_DERPT|nr:sentrin-specific protease 1-like [Dermatophagoides pteronyssinus]